MVEAKAKEKIVALRKEIGSLKTSVAEKEKAVVDLKAQTKAFVKVQQHKRKEALADMEKLAAGEYT